MASKLVYTCDRCGKEISENELNTIFINPLIEPIEIRHNPETGEQEISQATRAYHGSRDLCEECTLKLKEFIEGGTK